MDNITLFTSEYVQMGHPDKVADQISDAILDEAIRQDPMSRVAVECAATHNNVILFGELTTAGNIDLSSIVRQTLSDIGYDNPIWGYDPWRVSQFHSLVQQSSEISNAVSGSESIGAGDQGMMIGFAVSETPEEMPLALMLAREIIKEHDTRRKHLGSIWGPDAKSQVTLRYNDDIVIGIDTIVLSSVHMDGFPISMIREEMRDICTAAVIGYGYGHLLTTDTKLIMNSSGLWHHGGPSVDAGLTGRKIIMDTYGSMAPHGGGAFSSKDPTKVDRSGAYAARWLAKKINKCFDRHKTMVQISYAIGVPEPVSVSVSGLHEQEIRKFFDEYNIDLSPSGIINQFDLRRPIYLDTARNGHFGRLNLPWEQV